MTNGSPSLPFPIRLGYVCRRTRRQSSFKSMANGHGGPRLGAGRKPTKVEHVILLRETQPNCYEAIAKATDEDLTPIAVMQANMEFFHHRAAQVMATILAMPLGADADATHWLCCAFSPRQRRATPPRSAMGFGPTRGRAKPCDTSKTDCRHRVADRGSTRQPACRKAETASPTRTGLPDNGVARRRAGAPAPAGPRGRVRSHAPRRRAHPDEERPGASPRRTSPPRAHASQSAPSPCIMAGPSQPPEHSLSRRSSFPPRGLVPPPWDSRIWHMRRLLGYVCRRDRREPRTKAMANGWGGPRPGAGRKPTKVMHAILLRETQPGRFEPIADASAPL